MDYYAAPVAKLVEEFSRLPGWEIKPPRDWPFIYWTHPRTGGESCPVHCICQEEYKALFGVLQHDGYRPVQDMQQ